MMDLWNKVLKEIPQPERMKLIIKLSNLKVGEKLEFEANGKKWIAGCDGKWQLK